MFCQRCSRLPGPADVFRLIRTTGIRHHSKLVKSSDPTKRADLSGFPPDKIRNFCIVAHVDHGKSTLADRLMELTGVVEPGGQKQQLDKLQVERERGITVKAQSCSMVHNGYLLNLIDTPGHVDFSFEVSRSLVACNGILLLVAANEGVQAQTVANFWLAFNQNLHMIPVINKVDLTPAKVDQVELQMKSLFEFDKEDCIRISAKSGLNVPAILSAIIDRIPPPKANRDAPFRALIFDSWFIQFRGAIACILVKEGSVEVGQKIRSFHSDKEYEVSEVGVMHPEMTPCQVLYAGQVGYVVANMRTVQEAAVGETLFDVGNDAVQAFPGFAPVKPNVFSGLFPVDTADYENLKQALGRLCLNDPAVDVKPDSSPALGLGWRVGFLGLLHMEVFGQRLDQEYDASVILTAPNVQYKARIVDNDTIRKKRYNGKEEITIVDPSQFPDPSDVKTFLEPMVKVTMIVPSQYMGAVMALCTDRRGVQGNVSSIDDDRLIIVFRMPLAEVVVDFFDKLKQCTSGYASMEYEDDGYDETNLVKVTVSINAQPIEEFSMITPMKMARDRAKVIVRRLKEEIPQQQYDVDIKATVGNGGKAVASAKIHAMRKDFSQLLKGNFKDMSRLNKKLAHQAKGKKRMKEIGRIQVPKEAFINVLRHE